MVMTVGVAGVGDVGAEAGVADEEVGWGGAEGGRTNWYKGEEQGERCAG